MALTAKQELFGKEYIVDLNATQAAIRAGYSEKTAKSIGQENLTKPDLQLFIQGLMDERSKRVEITADMVLREYGKIGFSNISDYLQIRTAERTVAYNKDEEGNSFPVKELVQAVELFDSEMVDRVKMDAVAEIKQTRDGVSFKMHDKKGALDSIARHLGMFVDEVKHSGGMTITIEDQLRELIK